jgi:hypothetical protein
VRVVSVRQSMNMGVLGGVQVGVGIGVQKYDMRGAGGQGMGLSAWQTVSIGEAGSTLRFALG